MSNLNAPVAGGTVRGTNAADLITGSANADVLWGNGGNDVINGGDGNDVIEGDGVYTVADAVNATGSAMFSNLSIVNTTSLLPELSSLGVAASGQSVWRLRNTSNVAETVVFQSTSNGNGSFGPVTYVIPAHSDLLVTSTNPNTHKLYFNGAQIDVKSSGNQAFTYATALETAIDGNDTLSGGNGNDTIRGWGGDDTLNGDAGNDSLDGGTGNDKLAGGAGADYLNGGDGIDTADYSTSSAGVDVNLERGTGLGGDAQGDILVNIENLIGSNFNDVLVGNAQVNMIDGGAGDDTITGGSNNDKLYGGAGNDLFLVEWSFSGDYYDGGAGIDTFSADVAVLNAYAQEIDLATGTNNWEDHFVNIENLIGGSANDKFWGTETENSFWGRAGNDLLDGHGGDDKLYGEAGNDVLIGGAGNDLLDGGIGDDTLNGGAGADILTGGDGVDVADYSSSTAGVSVNLATGLGAGGDAQGDKLATIENLIGSNFADVLTGNAGANTLRAGAGNDVLVGSGGGDIMDGGADVDAADYSASTAGVQVNLATGLGIGGFAAGDTLISIENLVGSKFDDVLTGDAGANLISGGAGVDLVVGGAGADSLNGGADIDTVSYATSTAGVTVNLGLGTGLGGDAEGDTLSGFENLIGSNFADILFGDVGKNTISGGTGNDHLYGTGGGDTFDGGAGLDWIDYRNSTAAVTVNLATGVGSGGFAQGDTYVNIEDIRGSKFGDTLIGNDSANVIYAGAGTDIISGGGGNDMIYSGGGYDIINGGAGTDTLSYVNSWANVVASLATGIGAYGEASRDTITGIENLVGSKFDDTLTGDAGVNRLTGGAGADALNGGAGDDTLIGGTGGDTLNGGDGQDTANYAAALDAVTLNMATGGTGGDAAGDSFVSIEQIVGSAFNDVVTGNASDNRFDGGAGNDTIDGAGGIDYLYGNLGNDRLTGGAGADVFVFTGAFGNDTITDFWFGVGRTDRVQLVNTDLHSFADVLSHAVNSADGVVLSVDAGVDHITFTGVTLAQLNADDFLFA